MESPGLPRPAIASAVGLPKVRRQVAFELKGTMAPVAVLRLHTVDLMQIERQLRVKIAQRPQLFLHAPVLVDLGLLEEPGALSLTALVSLMRGHKLVPVGATNVPRAMGPALAAAGLGLLQATALAKPRAVTPEPERQPQREQEDPDKTPMPAPDAMAVVLAASRAPAPVPPPPPAAAAVRTPPPADAATPPPVPVPAPARLAHNGPMVVNHPVRSGQVVYAQNNDLVVLAPVNPGAQVMADGHVHIYSTLRGRAIAGALGLAGARIFVQKMEAELVAISDAYITADEIPAKLRGKSAQIYLEGRECRVEPL